VDSNHFFYDLFENKNFEKLFELAEFSPNKVDKKDAKMLNLSLGSFKIEWIFGLNFDEHQD